MALKRPSNISKESAKIFTALPHGDRSVKALTEFVKKKVSTGKKPFSKKGLDFGRHHSVKGKVIVDAGCGSGIKAIPIALAGAKHVIGVDASSEAIRRARAVARGMDVPNITFLTGYLEDLPQILKNNGIRRVDYIVNLQNLHHVEDWRGTLRVFHECLADKGILVCNVTDPTAGRGNFMLKNKIS